MSRLPSSRFNFKLSTRHSITFDREIHLEGDAFHPAHPCVDLAIRVQIQPTVAGIGIVHGKVFALGLELQALGFRPVDLAFKLELLGFRSRAFALGL